MTQESAAPINFLTFGETLIQRSADYIGPYDADGGYTMHVAGAESNAALNLVRLLPNRVRAAWVSRLGADPEGEMILAARGRAVIRRGGDAVRAPPLPLDFGLRQPRALMSTRPRSATPRANEDLRAGKSTFCEFSIAAKKVDIILCAMLF